MRFAKTMRLVVQVQDNDSSKIKRPYLEITYAVRATGSFSTNSTTFASFQVDISSDFVINIQ